MNDINSVTLIGRMTRDAELKYTSSGYAYLNFSIAVNRKKKQGDEWIDECNFFDIVLWGKLAESLCHYMEKGKQICVLGELEQERWEQDGKNRSKIKIIANNIQLLGSNSNNSNNFNQNQKNQVKPIATKSDNEFDDDIPFI